MQKKKTHKENLACICCICGPKGNKFQNVTQNLGILESSGGEPDLEVSEVHQQAERGLKESWEGEATEGQANHQPPGALLQCGQNVFQNES